MVTAVLLPNAKACFITSAGLPAVGYQLFTYDAGTLVPRTTYLDSAGAASNTNPIILDARGEAVIYWDGNYKVILKDSTGVTIWTADNVGQGPLSTPTPWVAAGGSADAITATYSPAVTALTDGLLLSFRASAANATTTPSFSPNGLTARTITKNGGNALVAGDIAANAAEVLVRYNLANTRWELLNPSVAVALPFVPIFLGSTVAGVGTYSTQLGTATMNGREVTGRFELVATSLGAATGNLLLGGLPKVVNGTYRGGIVIHEWSGFNLAANYGYIGGTTIAGTTTGRLMRNGITVNNSAPILIASDIGATITLVGTVNYNA